MILDDTSFVNDKGSSGDPKKYDSLGEYVKTDRWFINFGQPRANTTKTLVDDMFKKPEENPYPGWLGQGSIDDFKSR